MDNADFKYKFRNSVKCHVIAAAAALPTLRHDLFIIYFNRHQKWKAHHSFTPIANFHSFSFIIV